MKKLRRAKFDEKLRHWNIVDNILDFNLFNHRRIGSLEIINAN